MRNAKITLIASFMFVMVIFFQNCANPVQFEEKVNGSVLKFETVDGVLKVTEEFSSTISGDRGMVDLVWIIDNSGSMSNEAAIVRDNLSAFIDKVKGNANVKLKLMSEKGSDGEKVTIPYEDGDKFTQVDQFIHSNDGLLRVKDAMGAGKFDNFFRPGALKYFVVVTDDNSYSTDSKREYLKAKPFYDYVKSSLPGEAIKVSGFIGLKSSKCSIANVGTEYLNLRDQTGGYMFDICDEDWSENFDKLASDVNLSANNKFKLNFGNILSIDSIIINGQSIDPSLVEINGKSIIIKFDINQFAQNDTLNFQVQYSAAIKVAE